MKERTLEVDSVTKTFGLRSLLTHVYLKCKTNQVLGILGRNGAGKSTLLKIIFGSVNADNKSVRFDGQPQQKPFSKGNLVAYLPQHSFLPKNQPVNRIIKIYLPHPATRETISKHHRIQPHLNKRISELSGGERRYLEVLLILNLPVPFALLDEPLSAIEPIYREEIKELINTHRKKKGIILADHDYENLMTVSDQVLLIDNGICRTIEERKQLIEYNYLPPRVMSDSDDDKFIVDQQTLRDLDLLSGDREDGLFSIFEAPQTKGGKAQLHKLFHSPTRSKRTLENRQQSIKFFQEHEDILKIKKKQLDFISFYLDSGVAVSSPTLLDSLLSSAKNQYRASNDYYIKETGIRSVYEFLKDLSHLTLTLQRLNSPTYLSSIAFQIREIINENDLQEFVGGFDAKPFFLHISMDDFLLRKKWKQDLLWMLDAVYQLEAYCAIAKTTRNLQFTFPEFRESKEPEIDVKGLFHPQIQQATDNDFFLSVRENVCFLTGANMSGKSSFLKALGIAVYLAHLGLPVPASGMKISLFDGLITTINLSDNLNLGLSHFYSEVKRVKEVATHLMNKKRLVVIFDELFRGTNVKDAASASSLIIDALSKLKGSAYIISSHILEMAGELETNKNIFFKCFETQLVNNEPAYTYKLKDGVSKERLGLNIVLKEQILELLQGKLPPADK